MKYFKIYVSYKTLFQQLNAFEVKKLVCFMLDYVDSGTIPEIHGKRLRAAFEALKRLHDDELQKEREKKRSAGQKGAKRRWNSNAINKNSSAIKENGTAIKKNSSAING